MSVRENLEGIHPLTPAQQAWLIYSLSRTGDDPGFQQNRATLRGRLDLDALSRAWQLVTDRHEALRTSFHWRGLERPVQVIHRRVSAAFVAEDRSPGTQSPEERLDAYVDDDRRRGCEFSTPPLMRLAVIRTADDRWELVWSLHHLLVDGWSTALLSRELWTLYDRCRLGDEPRMSPAAPFTNYLRWLGRQDLGAAEEYWRDRFRDPPRTWLSVSTANAAVPVTTREIECDESLGQSLRTTARRHRLTLANVMLGAWALVLAKWRGGHDVIFGTTVSGRPPEVAQVEAIVGLLQHTLPVRVLMTAGAALADWLREIQATQVGAAPHQHAPFEQIVQWNGLPTADRLFDTLLVFENYPTGIPDDRPAGGVVVENLRGAVTSAYPLTVIIIPGARLRLRFHYDLSRIEADEVEWLERVWRAVLEQLASGGSRLGEVLLDDLLDDLPAPPHRAGAAAERHTSNVGETAFAENPRRATPMEQRVATIWSEELAVDKIAPDSNFFDLGGHSLVATRTLERLRTELGVTLDLDDLVFQTLRQVAAKCDRPR